MKFLVDANLPIQVARIFSDKGIETIHTSELPEGNASQDEEILQLAGDWAIISKDVDFYHSFLLRRRPRKLIMVKVGNMRIRALVELFRNEAGRILALLDQYDCLELYQDHIVVID